jgi:hypothetical protein
MWNISICRAIASLIAVQLRPVTPLLSSYQSDKFSGFITRLPGLVEAGGELRQELTERAAGIRLAHLRQSAGRLALLVLKIPNLYPVFGIERCSEPPGPAPLIGRAKRRRVPDAPL